MILIGTTLVVPFLPVLFKEACRQKVLLNPGVIYDQQSDRQLRISYAYASLDDIEKGLKILAGILGKLK